MTTLPDRLKAWRSSRQLSQPRAAQTLGVEVSTYRKWEYGLRHPSGAAMALIDRVLGEQPTTEQQKGEQ